MTKTIVPNKLDYAQKLKDPRWQQLRLKIFERDGWSCVSCSDTKSTLNAHHTYYASPEDNREPWDYEEESIISLCEDCHRNEHENLSESRAYLTRCISSAGLGSKSNLDALAIGFDFSRTYFDEKDACVLAFSIQSLLASKYVFENGSENKKIIEHNFVCIADPILWEKWSELYLKSLTPKKRARLEAEASQEAE